VVSAALQPWAAITGEGYYFCTDATCETPSQVMGRIPAPTKYVKAFSNWDLLRPGIMFFDHLALDLSVQEKETVGQIFQTWIPGFHHRLRLDQDYLICPGRRTSAPWPPMPCGKRCGRGSTS
jgi:hypothetical protein